MLYMHYYYGCIFRCSCAKGRVVLRQGHPGRLFYIVITGCVRVEVDVIDDFIDDAITVESLRYTSGATFGVSILRDTLKNIITVPTLSYIYILCCTHFYYCRS